jgi:hypothetical protein
LIFGFGNDLAVDFVIGWDYAFAKGGGLRGNEISQGKMQLNMQFIAHRRTVWARMRQNHRFSVPVAENPLCERVWIA